MAWTIKGCCCFRTTKTVSTVAGTFTLVTSLLQILVALSVFTGFSEMLDSPGVPSYLDKATTWSRLSDQQRNIAILYIVLACADAIIVFCSIIMLFGIEPKRPSRFYFYPWVLFMPFYIIYESAINIYFFVVAFDARKTPDDATFFFSTQRMMYMYGFLLVPLIYWAIKEIIILVFWFIVIFFAIEVNKTRKALKAEVVKETIPAPTGPSGMYCTRDACAMNRQPQPQVPIYQARDMAPAFQPGPCCGQRGCYAPSSPYRVY
jgi:hypothetical protein